MRAQHDSTSRPLTRLLVVALSALAFVLTSTPGQAAAAPPDSQTPAGVSAESKKAKRRAKRRQRRRQRRKLLAEAYALHEPAPSLAAAPTTLAQAPAATPAPPPVAPAPPEPSASAQEAPDELPPPAAPPLPAAFVPSFMTPPPSPAPNASTPAPMAQQPLDATSPPFGAPQQPLEAAQPAIASPLPAQPAPAPVPPPGPAAGEAQPEQLIIADPTKAADPTDAAPATPADPALLMPGALPDDSAASRDLAQADLHAEPEVAESTDVERGSAYFGVGLGAGMSNLMPETFAGSFAANLNIRFGGIVAHRLLIGLQATLVAQYNDWASQDVIGAALASGFLEVTVFPLSTSGWNLSAGAGWSYAIAILGAGAVEDAFVGTADDHGFCWMAATGYDFDAGEGLNFGIQARFQDNRLQMTEAVQSGSAVLWFNWY